MKFGPWEVIRYVSAIPLPSKRKYVLASQYDGPLCACDFLFEQFRIGFYYGCSVWLLPDRIFQNYVAHGVPSRPTSPGPMGNTLSSGFVVRTVLHFLVRRQRNPLSKGAR